MLSETSPELHDDGIVFLMALITFSKVSNRVTFVVPKMKYFFKKNMRIWYRRSHWRYSIKKIFWKISQNSQENTCARVSLLIKLQASGLFSCKSCEIYKNIFFKEHLWATNSIRYFVLLHFLGLACFAQLNSKSISINFLMEYFKQSLHTFIYC